MSARWCWWRSSVVQRISSMARRDTSLQHGARYWRKAGRLLAADENGRCLVIAEGGAVHVLTPSGEVAWRWVYSKINRFIDPQDTAVSPDCDAIAITGSATYKNTWVVDRTGTSAAIATTSTPAEVAFDPTGQRIAIGTFGGTLQVHTRAGALLETPRRRQAFLR